MTKEIELLKQEIKMLQSKLAFLEELEKTKTPVEEAYKEWWGEYPAIKENGDEWDDDDVRWDAFRYGWWAAQPKDDGVPVDEPENNEWKLAALRFGEVLSDIGPGGYYNFTAGEWVEWALNAYEKDTEPYCPDEPPEYDEIEWDEKDNPNLQKIIDEMVEERKSQKLWNILKDKWGFSKDACGDIVEAVAEWLPKEQNAKGSQNAYVECSVEGFNDCLTKIKGKLR